MKARSLVMILIVMAAAFLLGSQVLAGEFLQIQGSDTQVNLVQQLAEAYMEKYDDAVLSVTGGGSGTGVAALINGRVDVANVSRTMSDSELAQAEENNVEPFRIVIAMDGLSVVVHEDNPIGELTVDEIGSIFKGEITNWSDLGGADMEISLYGRQSNSGTFVYFRANVLKGDYSPRKRQMNSNAQIVESIKTDRGGIGYVGVGYAVEEGEIVQGLSILNVALDENSPAVSPLNPENVQTGLYPIARPLNQYFNGRPEGALLNFILFQIGEEGQKIAIDVGFYPINPEFQRMNEEHLDL